MQYNLAIYRTARAARSREFQQSLPMQDEMGIGRIVALLGMIADG
jgi:hypothetical protein